MPRPARLAAALLLAACVPPGAARAASASPVGSWRTYDDVDGKESGSVMIFDKDGALYGTITSITDPSKANAICTLCTGDRKDKPVNGMQVIRGLRPDGAAWDGGQIVDPKTGKVYDCSVRLEDGGQKLVVRGYVGVPMLGRSQTWIRK